MSRPSLRPLEEELARLPRSRPTPSSEALEDLLRRSSASSWLRHIDAIKVTGSNGKGSVATWTASILTAAGIRTGLTTSPHLHDLSERFVVDGQPIPVSLLLEAAERVRRGRRRLIAEGTDLIAFEAMTAMAVEVFALAKVEAVVAEAGIGGRHDATRLWPGTTHGLVSVDLEHRDLLGDGLPEIARHKADIANPGSTLMLGALPYALQEVVTRHGRRRGIDVLTFEPAVEVSHAAVTAEGMAFTVHVDGRAYADLRTAAAGDHQATNCGLAIRLAHHWLERHRPEILESAMFPSVVAKGVAAAHLPGRAERLLASPTVIVDTAHTPAALATLAELLPRLVAEGRWILVAGVSVDKAPEGLLAALLPPRCAHTTKVIATEARRRGGAATAVAQAVRRLAPQMPCDVLSTLSLALDRALDEARREGLGVVIAGGLFLAAEARGILLAEPG